MLSKLRVKSGKAASQDEVTLEMEVASQNEATSKDIVSWVQVV